MLIMKITNYVTQIMKITYCVMLCEDHLLCNAGSYYDLGKVGKCLGPTKVMGPTK